MKFVIKLLKEEVAEQHKAKKHAITKDSYKGVVESTKNIEELEQALKVLQKPAPVPKN